ncbi:MAG: ATP synthase F1 subunit gamma [Candidatus Neomarinimicrobiota bacterium]
MPNLKDIRDRIKSVQNIQKVTKAMKMVAAAKLRKAQERMEQARPYSRGISEVINHLLPDIDRNLLPLLEIRNVKRHGLVVVASDRGLAGSFNSGILRQAQEKIETLGRDNVDIFCIGKKARDYCLVRKYNVIESHFDFWNDLNFDRALKIGSGIINHFLNGKVDEILVIYNEFENISSQLILTEKILPLEFDGSGLSLANRLYEPSKADIVVNLVPRYLNVQMWKYLLESYASEQAARMVAMDNATNNADDMIKELTLEFNKARQTAITTEMLEIVSGAEALK